MESGRKWKQLTKWEWLYLGFSTAGLLTGLGFAIYGIIVDRFQTKDSGYLLVFSVHCCFCLIYVIKGIKNEHPYDILLLILSLAPIIAYLIYDLATAERIPDYKMARLGVAIFFVFGIGGVGIYHLKTFAKSKKYLQNYGVSFQNRAAPQQSEEHEGLKRNLRTMLIFYCLLIVNLQTDVKKESKRLLCVFGVTSVFLVAAGVYLLVKSAKDMGDTESDKGLWFALITAILMVFLRIVTCTGSYRAYKNFGKGLVQAVYGPLDSERRLLTQAYAEPSLNSIQNESRGYI